MKTTSYIFLSLLILTICSCVEEYNPDSELFDQQLVAIAELEANELGFIRVGSTFGVNTPQVDIDHDLSVIKVINFEEGNKPEEYRYDRNIEAYKNLTFRPKEGAIYDLNIDAKVPGVTAIYARTQVPYSTEFYPLENELIAEKYLSQGGDELSRFEVSIRIADDSNDEKYFHLIPEVSGDTKVVFDKIHNNKNAIHELSHRDGILIDKSKLDNTDNLSFSLHTTTPFEDAMPGSSYLSLELRTVTDAYYEYHLALSRQNASNAGPYTLPVTTYTNIENGNGIFATYSTTRDSVLIRG